jgi:4-nitrophenyl phosphatase
MPQEKNLNFKGFVIDLDGVVYKGSELISDSNKRIAAMRKKSKVLFLTNNSTRTRADYVKKLGGFGINVSEKEIITSAYATALYIKENYKKPNVFVIGEEGLKSELAWQGIQVGGFKDCNIVVVGLDRQFNYQKMALALRLIRGGADFIATNTDSTLITEKGILPGGGSIVSAVKAACGKEPIIIGKPSEIIGKIVLDKLKLKPADVLLLGDRLETDIAMGNILGMKTALVLTGLSKREDIEKTGIEPDFVLGQL